MSAVSRRRGHYMLGFAGLAMVAYLAPYIVLHADGRWLIWDNLDSVFVAYKVLLESGAVLAGNATLVDQPLGGLPRGSLPSELDALFWLYALLGPENAYLANRVLQTLVGFLGMRALLARHVFRGRGDGAVIDGVALCFALLPFWPFGGLGVAGMPLVVCAFLNIRAGDARPSNWLILIGYTLYSNLVLVGFFVLAALSALWCVDLVRGRRDTRLLRALALTSIAYTLTHYRLFLDFALASDFVSHRTDFARPASLSFGDALGRTLSLLKNGNPHALSLHWPVVAGCVAVGALCLARGPRDLRCLFFALASAVLVLSSLFYGFSRSAPLDELLAVVAGYLPMNLDRFHFLQPVLWMVLFALALDAFPGPERHVKSLQVTAIVAQVVIAAAHHELWVNRSGPTVREFFAAEQFEQIARAIDRPRSSYRVASFGLHPSIALYNGFHTIDGYFPSYPLAHKRAFREIIACELDKNPDLERYFDDWGSRVYVFSDELRRRGGDAANHGSRHGPARVRELCLNAAAFRALGAEFLISAVEIDQGPGGPFEALGRFGGEGSAWDLVVYRIRDGRADVSRP